MIPTVTPLTTWDTVYECARATRGLGPTDKHPSEEWRRWMLRAEHSPIRALTFLIKFDCPYYVAMHFVRHKIGVEWFVKSQRIDLERHKREQGEIVSVTCIANAQALISMARKRLCGKADVETRRIMGDICIAMAFVDAAMGQAMVPECSYRGECPEKNSCTLSIPVV